MPVSKTRYVAHLSAMLGRHPGVWDHRPTLSARQVRPMERGTL